MREKSSHLRTCFARLILHHFASCGEIFTNQSSKTDVRGQDARRILKSSLILGPHRMLNRFSLSTKPDKRQFQLTLLLSYSCGYRKAFDEYTSILNEKYPEILINGANYDPPGMNLYLSKSILFLKFVLIIVLMSSFDIWGYLGQAIPAWYRWCSENKLYACMMVFFVGNMLEAQVSVNFGRQSRLTLRLYFDEFANISAYIVWCIRNFIERCSHLVKTTNWPHSSTARTVPDNRQSFPVFKQSSRFRPMNGRRTDGYAKSCCVRAHIAEVHE